MSPCTTPVEDRTSDTIKCVHCGEEICCMCLAEHTPTGTPCDACEEIASQELAANPDVPESVKRLFGVTGTV